MSEKPQSINPWRALLVAFWGCDINYFPRVKDGERWKSLRSREVVEQAVSEFTKLKSLPEDDPRVERALSLARQSLDEVKALTEYQDSKATRLLTVLTFLSALAGVVFGRFLETFPIKDLPNKLLDVSRSDSGKLWFSDLILLTGVYTSFAFFVFFALCGGIITFHAIRTRFNYHKMKEANEPNSFIFYEGILNADPVTWARAFSKEYVSGKRELRDLRSLYLKNYIVETYLVAAKAADKFRYLAAGQWFQAWAMRFLLTFFIFSALVATFTAPLNYPDPTLGLREQIQKLNESITTLSSTIPQSISIELEKIEKSPDLEATIERLSNSLETLVDLIAISESTAVESPVGQKLPSVKEINDED